MLKAIKARLIIDGTGAEPIRDGIVLVKDDRIEQVGPANSVPVPESAEVIVLGEQTLLPGFVDPHSHVTINPGKGQPSHQVQAAPGTQLLRGVGFMRTDLLAGTTTMRILGENNNADFLMKQAIDDGLVPGPRLYVSGKAVRPSHGHGFMGTPANGVEAVRSTVRENLLNRADQIKMFVSGGVSDFHTELANSYYSREEIEAAADETERTGKMLIIHCKGGPGLRWAVEAGAKCVEHGYLATDDDLELMRKRGAWLGATLVNLYHERGNSPEIMNDPFRGAKARYAMAKMEEVFPKAVKGAVKWNVSTDARHGLLPFAIETAAKMGASNMQALQAATGWAAESCGLQDRVGTIQPGRFADLISLDGNPLEEIKAVYRVRMVMKGGERVDTLSAR